MKKKEQIHLYITSGLKRVIAREARLNGLSMNSYITMLLHKHLKNASSNSIS